MKKRKMFFSLATLAGVAFFVAKVFDKKHKNDTPIKKNTFDKLLANQIVVEKLCVQDLVKWIENLSFENKDTAYYMIAKPTNKVKDMFKLKLPDALDREHTMLFIAFDKDEYKVYEMTMVSYETIDDYLKELMENKDYTIIDGEN